MGAGQKILASEEMDDFIFMIHLLKQYVSLVIANNPNLLMRHIVDVAIVRSMLIVLKNVRLGTDGRRHDIFFLGVNAEEMPMRIIDPCVSLYLVLVYPRREKRRTLH